MRRAIASLALATAALAGLAGCATPASAHATSGPQSIYFLGDSWTQGISATHWQGFPVVTAEILGWHATIDGVGGTGYVAALSPGTHDFPDRVSDLPARAKADVVVVAGGVNDVGADATKFGADVTKTIRELSDHFTGARIVILGPGTNVLPVPAGLSRIDQLEKADASRLKVTYISQIEEGWFTKANLQEYIDPATLHPNTAGNAYIGGRLALALKTLEN